MWLQGELAAPCRCAAMSSVPGPVTAIAAFIAQLGICAFIWAIGGTSALPVPAPGPAPVEPVLTCPPAAEVSGWLLRGIWVSGFLTGVGACTLLFACAGGVVALGSQWGVGLAGALIGRFFTAPAAFERDIHLDGASASSAQRRRAIGFARSPASEEEW